MATEATEATEVIHPILKTINIHADADNGIELFLGPLEAVIMRAVWAKQVHTRAIFNYVRFNYEPIKTRELAFTSVTSTVDRLCKRGYLLRAGDRRAYTYTPFVPSEAVFIDRCLTSALVALLDAYPREAGRIVVLHAAGLRPKNRS